MIINRHPFSVRRSDFDQKDAYKYNSIDRYALDEDDSDKDSLDSDNDDEIEDNVDKQLKESDGDHNRKRTSGLAVKTDLGDIEDLEGDLVVEEIVSNGLTESVVISTESPKLDIDEDEGLGDGIESDLMSPVNSKKKSSDDVSDEEVK